MILPIVGYGASILKKKCTELTPDHPDLQGMIGNMWDTLYNAGGCGLAAPQVNVPYRMFLVDSLAIHDGLGRNDRNRFPGVDAGIKQVFINPEIIHYSLDKSWTAEEGCLSMPGVSGMVPRPWQITVAYCDQYFQPQVGDFSGMTARIIQHKYDHIEGKLYLDRLSAVKREMLKHRLSLIGEGRFAAAYPMI